MRKIKVDGDEAQTLKSYMDEFKNTLFEFMQARNDYWSKVHKLIDVDRDCPLHIDEDNEDLGFYVIHIGDESEPSVSTGANNDSNIPFPGNVRSIADMPTELKMMLVDAIMSGNPAIGVGFTGDTPEQPSKHNFRGDNVSAIKPDKKKMH